MLVKLEIAIPVIVQTATALTAGVVKIFT